MAKKAEIQITEEAVNSHDELVAALIACNEELKMYGRGDTYGSMAARAALSRATKQEG